MSSTTNETPSAGKIVLVSNNETATSTGSITVVPKGAGSEVTCEANVEPNGSPGWRPAVKLTFEHLGREIEDGIPRTVLTPQRSG